MATDHPLASTPMATDVVGLLEGMATTRSIRRYVDEPVPHDVLRDICFAATRAPTGSNRQRFRLIVLTDDDPASVSARAKQLIAAAARAAWAQKRAADGYDEGSGVDDDSPKARMARSMDTYIERLDRVPALIFPVLLPHRGMSASLGASVYPAMQNLLLAARGRGYGGVVTMWHAAVKAELHELLGLPAEAYLAATVTLGRPEGGHGPVRRLPLEEFVYDGAWGQTAPWAVDPPGTRHTSAGPPRAAS